MESGASPNPHNGAEELSGYLTRREKRVAVGTRVPGPITRRETAVCHKRHVRWCERGRKSPTRFSTSFYPILAPLKTPQTGKRGEKKCLLSGENGSIRKGSLKKRGKFPYVFWCSQKWRVFRGTRSVISRICLSALGQHALENLRSRSIAQTCILQIALGNERLQVALQGALRFISVMLMV